MSLYRKSLTAPNNLPTRWEFIKNDMLNLMRDLTDLLVKPLAILIVVLMIPSLLGLLSSWTVNGIAGQYYGQWYHHAGAWLLFGLVRFRGREPNPFER